MKTVLLTGSSGFIGMHTAERLIADGYKVIGVDIQKTEFWNEDFVFEQHDVMAKRKLSHLCNKHRPEYIIHLAAKAGVRKSIEDPELYFDNNLFGTLNILDIARDHQIKQIVFASSSSVYGANTKVPFSEEDPVRKQVSPYAASKLAGESLCHVYHKLYDLNIACLRFFTVYGPRGRTDMAPYKFIDKISRNIPIDMFGNGTSKRDYTYISDIVDGIVKSMKVTGFEIFNLGNSNTVELADFIKTIQTAVGKDAKINALPKQPGDVDVTYANISKAKCMLGWEPKVSLEEGIKKTVAWYNGKKYT